VRGPSGRVASVNTLLLLHHAIPVAQRVRNPRCNGAQSLSSPDSTPCKPSPVDQLLCRSGNTCRIRFVKEVGQKQSWPELATRTTPPAPKPGCARAVSTRAVVMSLSTRRGVTAKVLNAVGFALAISATVAQPAVPIDTPTRSSASHRWSAVSIGPVNTTSLYHLPAGLIRTRRTAIFSMQPLR